MREYPITNDKCPQCGSQERLGKEAFEELKEAGKLDKRSFPEGLVLKIPLLDPLHPPTLILAKSVKIPVIEIYFDICECFTLYCSKFSITEREMPIQMISQAPGTTGLPPKL